MIRGYGRGGENGELVECVVPCEILLTIAAVADDGPISHQAVFDSMHCIIDIFS